VKIRFEPLPVSGGSQVRGVSHEVIAEQLRERPREWAHVLTYPTRESASTVAYSIRNGHRSAWAPAGAFEAKSRTVNGEYRVYARYVGAPQ